MTTLIKNKIGFYISNPKISPFLDRRADTILKWVYKWKRINYFNQEIFNSEDVSKQPKLKYNYFNRYKLYQFILQKENLENRSIDYLEFGVYKGESLKWWVNNIKNPISRFFAFDTFQGLPEDWGPKSKGSFSAKGKLPSISDQRCYYEIGLFQETLYKFLEKYILDRKMIVHLDADLYSSTLFVLTTLSSKLKKGVIIIFDEFIDGMHEFRALCDFKVAYNFSYKILGFVNMETQIAIKVN